MVTLFNPIHIATNDLHADLLQRGVLFSVEETRSSPKIKKMLMINTNRYLEVSFSKAHRYFSLLPMILLVLLLAACGSIPQRHPLPPNSGKLATIPGLTEKARFWGDEVPDYLLEALRTATREEIQEAMPAWVGEEHNFLAISGGGQNGAFGAGLINGWTASGRRPEFLMVTGISTGALSAPFVFLGPDYDNELAAVYTLFSSVDLVKNRSWLEAATSDAALDTTELREIIASFIDDEMIARLAEEKSRGRRLFVGTTHLDAKRPVIWNITEIAASEYPEKKRLITDVLLASASIPGAFPPVLIEVEWNGQRYDEMHVDGGAVSQVFIYPPALDFRYFREQFGAETPHNIYVIRNSKLNPEWEIVTPGIRSVAKTAIDSLIRTQGLGDISQIYLLTLRDRGNYHLAFIPSEFVLKPDEVFDKDYMTALYKFGYTIAKDGNPWHSEPPAMQLMKFRKP